MSPSTRWPSIDTCWRTQTPIDRASSTKRVSTPESDRSDATAARARAASPRHWMRASTPGGAARWRMADSHTHSASADGRHRATWKRMFATGSTRRWGPTGAGPRAQCRRTPRASCRDELAGTATCVCWCGGVQRPMCAAALTQLRRPPRSTARRRPGGQSRVTSQERRSRCSAPRSTATRMPWVVKPAAFTVVEWAAPPRAATHETRSAVGRMPSSCRSPRGRCVAGRRIVEDAPTRLRVQEALPRERGIRRVLGTGRLPGPGRQGAEGPVPARSPAPGRWMRDLRPGNGCGRWMRDIGAGHRCGTSVRGHGCRGECGRMRGGFRGHARPRHPPPPRGR